MYIVYSVREHRAGFSAYISYISSNDGNELNTLKHKIDSENNTIEKFIYAFLNA